METHICNTAWFVAGLFAQQAIDALRWFINERKKQESQNEQRD